MQMCDERVHCAGIHVHTSLCPIPPLVYGDGSRVTQILVNLLGNAVKYSLPNAGPIALSLDIADVPSPHEKRDDLEDESSQVSGSPSKKRKVKAVFRVSDHGVGVEKEHRNSIFLQWTQVRETQSFGELSFLI